MSEGIQARMAFEALRAGTVTTEQVITLVDALNVASVLADHIDDFLPDAAVHALTADEFKAAIDAAIKEHP